MFWSVSAFAVESPRYCLRGNSCPAIVATDSLCRDNFTEGNVPRAVGGVKLRGAGLDCGDSCRRSWLRGPGLGVGHARGGGVAISSSAVCDLDSLGESNTLDTAVCAKATAIVFAEHSQWSKAAVNSTEVLLDVLVDWHCARNNFKNFGCDR